MTTENLIFKLRQNTISPFNLNEVADLIESLRQQLAGANARIELMGETALNQQKREVMLRDVIDKAATQIKRCDYTPARSALLQALATTANLSNLILCHAEPEVYACTQDIEMGTRHVDAMNCESRFYTVKLYRAWEPK